MIVGFYQYDKKYDFSGISGIIHVGAHEANEMETYRQDFGENIRMHWFEPDRKIFKRLADKLLKDSRCFLYNFALGSVAEKRKIWVEETGEGEASSLLAPKKVLEIYPTLKFTDGPDVYVRTLDSFKITDSDVLVLDVQGFELEVLRGSVETLPRIKHIFSEVNLSELYENCPDLSQLSEFLSHFGFQLRESFWTAGSWGDCYWSR